MPVSRVQVTHPQDLSFINHETRYCFQNGLNVWCSLGSAPVTQLGLCPSLLLEQRSKGAPD